MKPAVPQPAKHLFSVPTTPQTHQLSPCTLIAVNRLQPRPLPVSVSASHCTCRLLLLLPQQPQVKVQLLSWQAGGGAPLAPHLAPIRAPVLCHKSDAGNLQLFAALRTCDHSTGAQWQQ